MSLLSARAECSAQRRSIVNGSVEVSSSTIVSVMTLLRSKHPCQSAIAFLSIWRTAARLPGGGPGFLQLFGTMEKGREFAPVGSGSADVGFAGPTTKHWLSVNITSTFGFTVVVTLVRMRVGLLKLG